MNELIEDSIEELKRVDHLIYVTLKYTRTVDVLLSIVERMINSYEIVVDAILVHAKETGKIEHISDIPIEKAKQVKRLYDNEIITKNLDRYLLYRKLRRVKNVEKSNEYRRHVTMRAIVDNTIVELNIDNITEQYHDAKKFLEYITKRLEE